MAVGWYTCEAQSVTEGQQRCGVCSGGQGIQNVGATAELSGLQGLLGAKTRDYEEFSGDDWRCRGNAGSGFCDGGCFQSRMRPGVEDTRTKIADCCGVTQSREGIFGGVAEIQGGIGGPTFRPEWGMALGGKEHADIWHGTWVDGPFPIQEKGPRDSRCMWTEWSWCFAGLMIGDIREKTLHDFHLPAEISICLNNSSSDLVCLNEDRSPVGYDGGSVDGWRSSGAHMHNGRDARPDIKKEGTVDWKNIFGGVAEIWTCRIVALFLAFWFGWFGATVVKTHNRSSDVAADTGVITEVWCKHDYYCTGEGWRCRICLTQWEAKKRVGKYLQDTDASPMDGMDILIRKGNGGKDTDQEEGARKVGAGCHGDFGATNWRKARTDTQDDGWLGDGEAGRDMTKANEAEDGRDFRAIDHIPWDVRDRALNRVVMRERINSEEWGEESTRAQKRVMRKKMLENMPKYWEKSVDKGAPDPSNITSEHWNCGTAVGTCVEEARPPGVYMDMAKFQADTAHLTEEEREAAYDCQMKAAFSRGRERFLIPPVRQEVTTPKRENRHPDGGGISVGRMLEQVDLMGTLFCAPPPLSVAELMGQGVSIKILTAVTETGCGVLGQSHESVWRGVHLDSKKNTQGWHKRGTTKGTWEEIECLDQVKDTQNQSGYWWCWHDLLRMSADWQTEGEPPVVQMIWRVEAKGRMKTLVRSSRALEISFGGVADDGIQRPLAVSLRIAQSLECVS